MGADQVAAIRPMIAELEAASQREGGPEYYASFTVPDRDIAWVQIILGTLNFA